MPSGTFFRLPEEKKTRLIEAAWKEFSSVKFSETSINHIIHDAGIPRGSFYQYFEDKEDVLRFLLSDMGEYFFAIFDGALSHGKGQLHESALIILDIIMKENGVMDPKLARFLKLMYINPGYDIQQIIIEHPDKLTELFKKHVAPSRMRKNDEQFYRRACNLYIKSIASAIMEIVGGLYSFEKARANMETDIDILLNGFMLPGTECAAASGREM